MADSPHQELIRELEHHGRSRVGRGPELCLRAAAALEAAEKEDLASVDARDMRGLLRRLEAAEAKMPRWERAYQREHDEKVAAEKERDEDRAEVDYLRDSLSDIANFRRGKDLPREAYLMREKARIALTDSLTREAIRSNDAEFLAEVTALWSDYCGGGLDMAALAQEIGEALAARGVPTRV